MMSLANVVSYRAAGLMRQLSPKLYWRREIRRMHNREYQGEYEQRLVPFLCDRDRLSIDIGASVGAYSVILCSASTHVFAFEPRPALAASLKEMAEVCALPLDVKAVALSNEAGIARLRVPTMDGGRATIESANDLEDSDESPCLETSVPTACLDEYDFKNVGFIKIDVEGHELAVLQGAYNTIRRSMPTLLVEIEERHRPNSIEDVSQFLFSLGYEGFFILNDGVFNILTFDKNFHQNTSNISGWKSNYAKKGIYVNNFIWLPQGNEEKIRTAIEKTKRL